MLNHIKLGFLVLTPKIREIINPIFMNKYIHTVVVKSPMELGNDLDTIKTIKAAANKQIVNKIGLTSLLMFI